MKPFALHEPPVSPVLVLDALQTCTFSWLVYKLKYLYCPIKDTRLQYRTIHPKLNSELDNVLNPLTEGSLEGKLPTMWTDEKQRWEESEMRREEKKKEDQKEGRREEAIRSKR
jgi:hypothetical protein